jgi:hypothetical protein
MTRTHRIRSLVACAAVTLAALVSVASADLVDDAIRDIQAAAKAGDAAVCLARIRALQGLQDANDPRVLTMVRELAKSDVDEIACAAIVLGAASKDPKLLEWMRSKIADKDLWKEKGGRPALYRCILEALPRYRDPATLKPLEDAVRDFLQTDAELAKLAIRAYGSVPQKAVVDQLLDWLESLEQSHRGKSSGGAGKTKYHPEVQKARDASRAAILDTLAALTGLDVGDSTAWRKWWNDHARSFEFPPPDQDANLDWSKLTVYTDTRYGYTAHRPAGDGWVFRPPGPHFRAEILRQDATGVWQAFVGWNVHRSAGSYIKDAKDLADWWVRKEMPDHEFASYGPGGEPTIEQRTFGKRDWYVVVARGVTKQEIAAWGTVEHRVYITKVEAGWLYVWAIAKDTAPAQDKLEAWEAAEKTIVVEK